MFRSIRDRSGTKTNSLPSARRARRMTKLAQRFRDDTSGTIIIMAAIMLPVVVGGMGMGAEAGLWYHTQRQLQHAADTASHGAGIRKRQGDSQTEIEAVALALAIKGGFKPGRGTIQVYNPPASGPNVGNTRAVSVVLNEDVPRLFTSIYSSSPVNIGSRAVSIYTNPSFACVLALAPNESASLRAPGSTNVNLTDCDTASNSMANDAFDMNGAAGYTTDCVHTVGYAQPTNGLTLTDCAEVDELAAITRDPYKDVAMPSVEGPCKPRNVGNPHHGITTVNPTYNHSSYATSGLKSHRYCFGLQVKGRVHFKSGIYIIEGLNFSANAGADITGDNVMFFFTGGARSMLNGGADIDMSPPNSGDYSGILFFGDRTEPQLSHVVNGGSNSDFTGAIYFPAQDVIYNGNAGVAAGCTQIIGYTIEFTGTSDVGLDCTGVGVKDIEVAASVIIVE